MDQAEERICEVEDRNFEITPSEENTEKRVKKLSTIYGIPPKEIICELLELQREKVIRKLI